MPRCKLHSASCLQSSGPLSNPQQPWLARSRRPASPPVARPPASRSAHCRATLCCLEHSAVFAGVCVVQAVLVAGLACCHVRCDAVSRSADAFARLSPCSSRRRPLASPRPLPVSRPRTFLLPGEAALLCCAAAAFEKHQMRLRVMQHSLTLSCPSCRRREEAPPLPPGYRGAA